MTDPISLFKTTKGEALSRAAYDAVLRIWPVPYESLNVHTRFGPTHLIACGPESGQPLILLHGQEASATMWLYNIQELSQEYQVYALDTVGDIGISRPTSLPKDRSEYAAWLLDVLEQLGLAQVALAGISYGGFLALNFAAAHPQKVKRIVLLAPGIPNFGPPTFRWALYGLPMLMIPSRFIVKRFINGASIKGYSRQDLVQEHMMVSVPYLRNRNFMRPVFHHKELGQVSAPCMLLIGDHEIMYEPVKAAARACELIPNLTMKLIPNASHMLNSDQPEIVNDLILRFL